MYFKTNGGILCTIFLHHAFFFKEINSWNLFTFYSIYIYKFIEHCNRLQYSSLFLVIGLHILLTLEALLVKKSIINFSLDLGFGHIFFGQWIVGRSDSVSFKVEVLRDIICFHVLLV